MARLRSVLYGLSPPLHFCHMFVAYLAHYVLPRASPIAYLSIFTTLHVACFSTLHIGMFSLHCIWHALLIQFHVAYLTHVAYVRYIAYLHHILLGLGCQTKHEN